MPILSRVFFKLGDTLENELHFGWRLGSLQLLLIFEFLAFGEALMRRSWLISLLQRDQIVEKVLLPFQLLLLQKNCFSVFLSSDAIAVHNGLTVRQHLLRSVLRRRFA